MEKRTKENLRDDIRHQSTNHDQGISITVDNGKLPAWPVFMAMTMAYAESKAYLEHALGSSDLTSQFIDFGYRMHFTEPMTGERRVIVQRGDENSVHAAVLGWDLAVSILTLIRLQNYTATYGESGVISLYFSFGGDEERKSDMERMMLLLEERPEFQLLNISHDLKEVADAKAEKEGEEAEKESLSSSASQR